MRLYYRDDFWNFTGFFRYPESQNTENFLITTITKKKIDEADKSETVYTKESNRYNMGYTISATENGLSAQSVKMQEDGHVAPAKRSQNLDLEQTDDGVFQYKKKDGSLVLTFAYPDQELQIMEFTKDGSGNFRKESTLILKKALNH